MGAAVVALPVGMAIGSGCVYAFRWWWMRRHPDWPWWKPLRYRRYRRWVDNGRQGRP